jgi:4-amino-4-deoxy-L-arabinose transferase-like glycosyltransferase
MPGHRRRCGVALAAALCGLYLLLLALPVHRHTVGVFSDFYRFYAPDADRIAARQFPQNTHNPPGYPALLALASPLTGDRFSAGKWISLLAAALCGLLAFQLHRRVFGEAPALLAALILLTSPTFTTYAISPMTDVPFVALALAAMLTMASAQPPGWPSTIAGGLLTGAAILFRYNGAFLLGPGLVSAVWRTGGAWPRAAAAAVYLGIVALAVGAWAGLNHAHHGTPFRSTNYIDVAKALALHGDFRSLADVVLADPWRFAWNYALNAGDIALHTLGARLVLFPVGPLAVLGLGLGLLRRRGRALLVVLAGCLAFLLFMSLTHWEPRYHLFLLACYAGFAGFAIAELAREAARWWRWPVGAWLVVAALALLIALPAAGRSWRAVETVLSRQPVELLPAADYLRRTAAPGATVMAMRAQIAYLGGREWRELPSADSLPQLEAALRERPPDYLVYDRWMRRLRGGLAALGTPDGEVAWLEPVYRDPAGGVVIYAVRLPRPAAPR